MKNLDTSREKQPLITTVPAIPIVFIQINDVYFIDAKADYSKPGGLVLPRVATLVKRLRRYFNHLWFCVPGDFLAPSCFSKHFKGNHMIDVFNEMGIDYVTFGNHEFEDIFTPAQLSALIKKSKFKWISANFEARDSELSDSYLPYHGTRLTERVYLFLAGFLYKKQYKRFGMVHDPIESAENFVRLWQEAVAEIYDGKGPTPVPLFVALTHQLLADDIAFADALPQFRLLMGGHDHDQLYSHKHQNTRTLIIKSASNARTVRINCFVTFKKEDINPYLKNKPDLRRLLWSSTMFIRDRIMNVVYFGRPTLTKEEEGKQADWIRNFRKSPEHINTKIEFLQSVGDLYVGFFTIAIRTTQPQFLDLVTEDADVKSVIERLTEMFVAESGIDARPILAAPTSLYGEDTSLRTKSTNLGNLAADIVRGGPNPVGRTDRIAEIGLLNSGALRIDRVLPKGEGLSERTICDLFFHRNEVRLYEQIPGRDIRTLLEKSLKLRIEGGVNGDGDFLQISGLQAVVKNGRLTDVFVHIDGKRKTLIRDEGLYAVACNDYIVKICKDYSPIFSSLKYQRVGRLSDLFKQTLDRMASCTFADGLDGIFANLEEARWSGL